MQQQCKTVKCYSNAIIIMHSHAKIELFCLCQVCEWQKNSPSFECVLMGEKNVYVSLIYENAIGKGQS